MRNLLFVLYILLLVAMAAATFIEKWHGTDFAHSAVYSSWWFVALWAGLAVTGTAYIIKRRTRRLSVIALHLALLLILAGALVTHVSGERGMVHLRCGASVDTYTVTDDRGNALFEGSDSIRGGRFSMEIPVPYDISYSDATGRIYVYAVSNDHSLECHGYDDRFHLNGTAESAEPDTVGPKVFVALDSMDFPNGGKVGRETLLLATISDDNGINTTGNGLGHDLELTIDGDKAGSYILNDYFSYDFGTYRSGSISYQLQDLTDLEVIRWLNLIDLS